MAQATSRKPKQRGYKPSFAPELLKLWLSYDERKEETPTSVLREQYLVEQKASGQ